MTLTRDDVFEILRSRRRRFAIHYLRQNGEPAELGTLSEHVAAWEQGKSVNEVGSSHRKNVYTSLQQFHLPKMSDLDMVEFDRRAGEVELTDDAEEVDIYLEVVRDRDIPWSLYYLGIGIASGAVFWAHTAGVPLVAALSVVELGIFTVTAIGVLSLVHTVYTRRMRLGNDGPPPEVGG
ncbi:MAG: transcriptional regulator [Haloferacaceae archaeon]